MTRPMCAQYCVPAHMAQGSTVVTSVHCPQHVAASRSDWAASRASTASAWLTAVDVALRHQHGVADRGPTSTAPNGWWPDAAACSASALARCSKAITWQSRSARCSLLMRVTVRCPHQAVLRAAVRPARWCAFSTTREQFVHHHRHQRRWSTRPAEGQAACCMLSCRRSA